MNEITFRHLNPADFDAAYQILREVTDWLLAKGIQQWVRPFPVEMYRERHDDGRNYGLFVDDELAVVGTLMPNLPLYWGDYPPEKPFVWLSTLATALKFQKQGRGQAMLQHIETHCISENIRNIYLDCAEGFLPSYYQAAGYEPLVHHQFNFPHGEFNAVLMRRTLSEAS